MSFTIAYFTDRAGARTATVQLKCNRCGHTGTAHFSEDSRQRSWKPESLTNDTNGRGDFIQSEIEKHLGHTYCTCAGQVVFELRYLR